MNIINLLLTHPVCKQVTTMGIYTGNDQFCSVNTRLPHLTISTFAESNIIKQCPISRFTDSASLEFSTITPGSEVMEISKYLEHNSFFPPNATQFKDMNVCVINWLWSNNKRSWLKLKSS